MDSPADAREEAEGACVSCAAGATCSAPNNPCQTGTTSCSTVQPVCQGLQKVPDGAMCNGDMVCCGGMCGMPQTDSHGCGPCHNDCG